MEHSELWAKLTPHNQERAVAYARKLLAKQQVSVTTAGQPAREYNSLAAALQDLSHALTAGHDLKITNLAGETVRRFIWYTQERAKELGAPAMARAITNTAAGLWLETIPGEDEAAAEEMRD